MGSGRRGVSICFATSSLIGVGGVKLNLSTCSLDWRLVRVGHTLLFAVGARPPHNGVRKARRLNLFRDFGDLAADEFQTLSEIVLPFVPTGTISFTLRANILSVGLSESSQAATPR